ncbi:hypothetical protein FRC12_000344 [Ceratobasidium sp. 428]|nr:hypothetical protein FRC12_000344 [Ceratobasidium sp. 428]
MKEAKKWILHVKLNVIVGTMNLTDRFEWNINPDNPEEFAEACCRDLGLGGDF